MKRSVESPIKPTALFFMAFFIVWHMSPGKWKGWDGGGGGVCPGWVVGWVYSLRTMSMLNSLILATLVVEHALDTAILIWSLSAAFWAD